MRPLRFRKIHVKKIARPVGRTQQARCEDRLMVLIDSHTGRQMQAMGER